MMRAFITCATWVTLFGYAVGYGTPSMATSAPFGPGFEALVSDELNTLIQIALRQNPDLRAATYRRAQASALAWQSLAPTLPVVSLELQGNAAPFESLGFQFGGIPGAGGADPPFLYSTGAAQLQARTQIDLGRSLQTYQASNHDAEAQGNDRDAFAVNLATLVAQAYFDLLAARMQVALIEDQIKTNQALTELTELRFQEGGNPGLDVLQQRQQLAAARSRLPPARTQAEVLEQQLWLLVGPTSADLSVSATALPAVPPWGEGVDIESTVRALPEVKAAKMRVQAAGERVWAARLAFLPTLGVSGNVGYQGIAIDEPRTQMVWGFGGSVSIPLFQGGRNLAGLQAAEAAEQAALMQLEQVERQATQAIQAAFTRNRELSTLVRATEEQAEAASAALNLARERYAAGLSSYLALLTAVSTEQAAKLSVLDARRQSIRARVELLDALGQSAHWAHANKGDDTAARTTSAPASTDAASNTSPGGERPAPPSDVRTDRSPS